MRGRLRVPSLAAGAVAAAVLAAAAFSSLGSCSARASEGKKVIVVSYSILASLVRDLAGESFDVSVSIPDGLDPHEWEPSARDIEAINGAALVVENGLGLEEGMQKALAQARRAGRRIFTASEHVELQRVGAGQAGSDAGALDPHLWTDPLAMRAVVDALADTIRSDFGLDLSGRRAEIDARLEALDAETRVAVARLPAGKRVLVTAHESLGYFARRYGFRIVGAVVPSLSSQAESSAAELSTLKSLIAANGVRAIFVESGTNPMLAKTLAAEAGIRIVPLAMHSLPKGGGYVEYVRGLAAAITGALAP
jgi:zinc/manganese transport system substrate-binding protein